MRVSLMTDDYGEYLHYGAPLTLVTTLDRDGKINVATNASTLPLPGSTPRLAIGVLKDNLTNQLIAQSGEFVVNLLTSEMRGIAKLCGEHSGDSIDKLKLSGLSTEPAQHVKAPIITECPMSIECAVEYTQALGDIDLFVARILAVSVAPGWSNGHGEMNLDAFDPLLYAFGHTFRRGSEVGRGSI